LIEKGRQDIQNMEKLEAMLLEKIKNTQGMQANAFRTLAQAMDA
jgi:hypothetical protein